MGRVDLVSLQQFSQQFSHCDRTVRGKQASTFPMTFIPFKTFDKYSGKPKLRLLVSF